MIPLISLTWTIFALTGLRSLYIAIVGITILTLSMLFISKRKAFLCFFVSLITIVAVFFSDYNYQRNMASGNYYTGEGIITDRVKQGRYILTNSQGQEYFFQTKEVLKLGQTLFVSSYVNSPTKTGSYLQWPDRKKIKESFIEGSNFDYNMRQRMKGVYGTMYSPSYVITGISDKAVSRIRQSLSDSVQTTWSGDTAGLVLGMIIGDKSLFSSQTYQAYIDSSLVHLVAVSGGNIVLLLLFLRFFFFWIPFYPRICLLALAVCIYAILCGADSSVIRATIMGLLSLAALFTGRLISIRRLLSYARCGMLLYNPLFLVYDVGFLLSFSAIVGIVIVSLIASKLQEEINVVDTRDKKQILENHVSKYIYAFYKEYILPTLGASMGVLPIILFFMGSNNLLGVVANICAAFLVPIVMIGGIIVVTISSLGELLNISLLGLTNFIAFFVTFAADLIRNLSYLSSQYGIYLSVGKPWFVSTMLIGFVGALLCIFTPKKTDYFLSGHGSKG